MVPAVVMDVNLNTIALLGNAVMLVGSVAAVVYKLGRAVEKFEAIGAQQASEITQLKAEVKIVTEVMTKIALTTQRQDVLEQRLNRQEQLLDDVRRGEGMILPLNRHLEQP